MKLKQIIAILLLFALYLFVGGLAGLMDYHQQHQLVYLSDSVIFWNSVMMSLFIVIAMMLFFGIIVWCLKAITD